jgi:hypothetical protein
MPNVDLVHASPTGASAWEVPPAEEDPMTADAHPRDHAHRRDHDRPPVTDRRWIALIVIAVAPLMTALDATVVNIALPSAQRSLAALLPACAAAVALITVRAARPAARPHL